jgi:hypothetical protein
MPQDLAAAIEDRLRQKREAAARRREDLARFRTQKQRARDAGLKVRHATKLHRMRRRRA